MAVERRFGWATSCDEKFGGSVRIGRARRIGGGTWRRTFASAPPSEVSQPAGVPELLQALALVLPRWCDGWYLFGAQAVQAWGTPRLSADVDITIQLRSADLGPFLAAMRGAGFTSRVPDPEAFARETRILPLVHEPSRIPVDAVLAGPGPEEEFLARATTTSIGGVRVPVISPEDLVVTKVLAGREKDLEDVRGILRQADTRFDAVRVRSLLSSFEEALGRSDLVVLFEELLTAAGRKSR